MCYSNGECGFERAGIRIVNMGDGRSGVGELGWHGKLERVARTGYEYTINVIPSMRIKCLSDEPVLLRCVDGPSRINNSPNTIS